jgi:crossover junction endodeoxyribonuclease RusA
MFALTVLGEPVPKGRPRVVNGHTFTPPRTVEAETEIATLARAQCSVPMRDPCAVFVNFYCRRKGRGDVDNLAKTVLDALNEIVWADDKQVVHLDAWVTDISRVKGEFPRTEIRVERIGAAE